MLVYPLRKLSPRTLVIVAVLVMLPSVPFTAAVSNVFQSLRDASVRLQQAEQNGEAVSPEDKELAKGFAEPRENEHDRGPGRRVRARKAMLVVKSSSSGANKSGLAKPPRFPDRWRSKPVFEYIASYRKH